MRHYENFLEEVDAETVVNLYELKKYIDAMDDENFYGDRYICSRLLEVIIDSAQAGSYYHFYGNAKAQPALQKFLDWAKVTVKYVGKQSSIILFQFEENLVEKAIAYVIHFIKERRIPK